jgi:hypothetical protein
MGFPILNAWPRNQAFQFQDNIKSLLELPFIFSVFPICRLKKRFSKISVLPLLLFAINPPYQCLSV